MAGRPTPERLADIHAENQIAASRLDEMAIEAEYKQWMVDWFDGKPPPKHFSPDDMVRTFNRAWILSRKAERAAIIERITAEQAKYRTDETAGRAVRGALEYALEAIKARYP